MKLHNLLVWAAVSLPFTNIVAQQDAMYTHYMQNTLGVNPAYAGSRDALTVNALHRMQWVGFKGAPQSSLLTVHTPFKNDHIGLGLTLGNDIIGPTNTSTVMVDFAYRITLNNKSRLSFGLKGGGNIFKANLAEVSTIEQGDQSFAANVRSRFLPNFGTGVYYSTARFYTGLSVPRLLENDYFDNTSTGGVALSKEKRHYYFIAGTLIRLNEKFDLKPTTFVKAVAGAPIEADITASLVYNNKISAGAMFRSGDATGLLLGLNVNPQFYIGYSFDWSFTNTTLRYNSGSHELMVRYDFIFNDDQKLVSPRTF